MSIKELSKKLEEQKLVPGHRSCAGCGFPQIIRTVLASSDKPVVVSNATGCMEVTTTIYPFSSWNVPWIHSAFENAASTITGAETAYKALKEKGKIKDSINFVAFGGDGGTYDIGLQALSGALERGHNFVYILYDNEAYMNCLSTDTLIMTEGGLKKITDIKLGEKVYAFNQKTYQLVLKRCTGIFDNGVKKVFELNTLHHTIKATSNHPFLTVKRSGRGKKIILVWKTLGKLKKSDEIVTLKKLKNKKKKPDIKKYLSQTKQRDFLADNEYFSTEKVISIKYVNEEQTLDLRVEGEHNFVADGIVVHNTGIQRSSATPYGASTTTAPAGKVHPGKEEFRKDITKIVVAHNIPYVAQASIHNLIDLSMKAEKAFKAQGPAFINVLQPCTLGWRYPPSQTIKIAKLAVDCKFWPLYEVEDGNYKLNYNPSNPIPIEDYMKTQGRFKHLFKPANRYIIEKIQKHVDSEWEKLLKLCNAT